ncbi:MAG TPA: inorganic pyrophosphatase [Anaerolineae bacterium]|nr:inorganic pyrophosphatase [Anaerolineae bacterium]HQK15740.1 inorganic pyrophosphatase [Anaerolineae bacterium]
MNGFWEQLEALVAGSRVVIDRPKGTAHPRYPAFIYPLDYGYLDGTGTIDGGGVDVWVGSLPERRVTAIICAVDLVKRDTELKLLLGCTPEEAALIVQVHNGEFQAAILIPREG